MPARAQPELLTTIQGARGVAAMAVVLAHSGTILGLPQYMGYAPFGGVFRGGHAGVDFFFVLSGFIIATVHAGDIGRPEAAGVYLWKRFVRVYPAYWVAIGIAIAITALGVSGAVSETFRDIDFSGLAASLALVPQHLEPPLGVAWTLEHEILFYVAFTSLILHRRAGMVTMASWFGWSIVATFVTPVELAPWSPTDLATGLFGSSYHLQFAAGMAVAALVARDRVPFPRAMALIGAAAFALTAAAEDTDRIVYLGQIGRLMFGLSASLAVGGLASAERRGLIRCSRIPVLMGAASYSIYLIHVPAMTVFAGGVVATGLPGWSAMPLLAAGGIVSGLLLHVLVERPGLAVLRDLIPGTGVMRENPVAIVAGETDLGQGNFRFRRARPFSRCRF